MKRGTPLPGRPATPRTGSPGTQYLVAATGMCALLTAPAAAIELGEINVHSSLGQPLRASIAFALAPNEQIAADCVYLRAAGVDTALPAVTRAATSINGNRIVLQGRTPLREPMMSLQLAVECAYTANLTRDYLLLLNPPGREPAAAGAQAAERAVPVAATPRQSAAPATATRRAPPVATSGRGAAPALAAGSEYRVQPGDTLSGIVSRIENRELRLWDAVDAIFAANPAAFRNGDVDRLIAGAVLQIPATVGAAVPTQALPTPVQASVNEAYRGLADAPARTPAARAASVPDAVVAPAPAEAANIAAVETPVTTPAATDVAAPPVVESAAPAQAVAADVEPTADATPAPVATIDIPDTVIEQRRPEPVPVAALDEDSGQSWLAWLGGSGVAIVLGLLLFGRRLREKLGGPVDDLDATQVNAELLNRRRSDHGLPDSSDNLNLHETMSQANQLAFKNDGDIDHVLDTGEDIDVALDYSFASSGNYTNDVDMLLDDSQVEEQETDIIPPQKRASGIEVSEADDDTASEYEMSMILDVTRQDFADSPATARDLQAVEIEPPSSPMYQTRSLDLTTEVEHAILEQDYEHELTATQALNKEIAAAARELQDRLAEFDTDQSRISMAEDLEGTAEVTAEMPHRRPAENDGLGDLDDTDISEQLTAQLPEGGEDTVDIDIDDLDATVEHRSKAG